MILTSLVPRFNRFMVNVGNWSFVEKTNDCSSLLIEVEGWKKNCWELPSPEGFGIWFSYRTWVFLPIFWGWWSQLWLAARKKNNNTCSGMEKMYMSYNDSGGGCQCGGKACWKKQLKVGKYGQIAINTGKGFSTWKRTCWHQELSFGFIRNFFYFPKLCGRPWIYAHILKITFLLFLSVYVSYQWPHVHLW